MGLRLEQMLVANNLEHQEGRRLITPYVEALEVIIKTSPQSLAITGIYRSPAASSDENLALISFLHTVVSTGGKVLLVGDLSAPEFDWLAEEASRGSFGESLLGAIHGRALVIYVHENTGWRFGQTTSLLDLVVSRSPSADSDLKVEDPIERSDHGVIRFMFDLRGLMVAHKNRRIRCGVEAMELVRRSSALTWTTSSQGD